MYISLITHNSQEKFWRIACGASGIFKTHGTRLNCLNFTTTVAPSVEWTMIFWNCMQFFIHKRRYCSQGCNFAPNDPVSQAVFFFLRQLLGHLRTSVYHSALLLSPSYVPLLLGTSQDTISLFFQGLAILWHH